MALLQQLISGSWNSSGNERFLYNNSEKAIAYHSITFFDPYKEYLAKKNNDELIVTTHIEDSATIKSTVIKGYNTWDDFMLIPSNAPVIQMSQVSPTYTDLNSWDGSIDETQVLKNNNDGMYWQMISGNWDFILDMEYKYVWRSFYYWYTEFLEAIHGQKKFITLCEDQSKLYTGRIMVEDVTDDGEGSNITVSLAYNIQPILYSGDEIDMLSYYKSGTLVKYDTGLVIDG